MGKIVGMPRGVRQVRRWARTTPNTQIGTTLMGIGCACLLVVLLLLGMSSHWI